MRFRMRSGAAAAAVLATVVTTGVAAGATIGNPYPSQQQVDQAKAQVQKKLKGVKAIESALTQAQNAAQAANNQAEMAAEAYNGAMWKLSLAQEASRKANASAKAAAARVEAQRSNIARLAAASYQNSTDFTSLNAILGGTTPSEMLQRSGVVAMANAPMQAAFENFQKLSNAAQTAKAKAQAAEVAQQGLADKAAQAKNVAAMAAASAQQTEQAVATQRNQLLQQLATAQHVSVALATQRQNALEAIARARAARIAAAKARAAAAAAAAAARNNGSSNAGNSSAPSPGGIQAVIAFARAQLGKPYVWAGAGPDVWDCSGLTMMAFRQIGIYMPHYATSQYLQGTPIPVSAARPGDLLFWTNDGTVSGIHHVALYIGNGTFIEAPHTGANVRYDTLYGLDGYPDFAARM